MAGLINPEDKQKYLQWLVRNNIASTNDYDMQAFWQNMLAGHPSASSGLNPNDGQLHFSDRWKLPNHPTFSTDSQYNDPSSMPNTPTWSGGLLSNGHDQSWMLRRPNGDIVESEVPWKKGLLQYFGKIGE